MRWALRSVFLLTSHLLSPKTPFEFRAMINSQWKKPRWVSKTQFMPKFTHTVPFVTVWEGPVLVKSRDSVVEAPGLYLCQLPDRGQALVLLSGAKFLIGKTTK